MNHQDFSLIGIRILQMIPIIKMKLCQKSMTSNSYMKDFTINLKLIGQYQWKDTSLMAKYKNVPTKPVISFRK